MQQNNTIGCCEAKDRGEGVGLWSETWLEKPKRSKKITRSNHTLLDDNKISKMIEYMVRIQESKNRISK